MKISNLLYIPILFLMGCESTGNTHESKDNLLPINASVFFRTPKVNLGELKTEDSTLIKYYAINTSDTPLIIDSVQSSCVCTISSFPKQPIMKNDSGLIVALFKSKQGQHGAFSKSIIVLANTKPAFTVLSFHGILIDK